MLSAKDLYTNTSYKKNAEKTGQKMQSETFRMEICRTIEK